LCQDAFLLAEYGGLALSTVPDNKKILDPPSKSKNARFTTEERKAKTCYSAGSTKSSVPQGTQKLSSSHCTSLQQSNASSVQDLESQLLHPLAVHYPSGARRHTPIVHRNLLLPTVTAGSPWAPIKEQVLQVPFLRGGKRQLEPQQGVTYPA
jgi:hypothetical protein